ncbi:MAG: hypothetical protein A2144_09065 [Chloroflexi bacterium RBG_16_50_9]|nr:MAG: hypothetical protein A2144_09065 [Chloroflexi bacterium RBG_16_50_9]
MWNDLTPVSPIAKGGKYKRGAFAPLKRANPGYRSTENMKPLTKRLLKRFVIFFLSFVILWLVTAFYVNFGIAMLIFALWHITFSTIVFRPQIGEWISGRKYDDKVKAQLAQRASSTLFKIWWIVTNIAWIGIAVFIISLNFRLIDLIRGIIEGR